MIGGGAPMNPVIAGFFRFDGAAVAALPPVIAAALAAACVIVMAGAASVGLSGRRARRRRVRRAVMVDFTGQRLTPYDAEMEGDFYEPTLSERGESTQRRSPVQLRASSLIDGDRPRSLSVDVNGADKVGKAPVADVPRTVSRAVGFPTADLSDAALERLWSDLQAVGEPGGLQRVVDGLNEAS